MRRWCGADPALHNCAAERCSRQRRTELYTEPADATVSEPELSVFTLCECEISNSLMLRDERFIISRAIVAITNLPRVRPRKLPRLASLSLGAALSISHRSPFGDSPHKGDTMYKSLMETD